MYLTVADSHALAKHPATVLKALIEVASTFPDLENLRLAVAAHPETGALAHAWKHRHDELAAAHRQAEQRELAHSLITECPS